MLSPTAFSLERTLGTGLGKLQELFGHGDEEKISALTRKLNLQLSVIRNFLNIFLNTGTR